MTSSASHENDADVDVLIVGAGFAGMYMLHKARQLGLSARVLEAGAGVGGTWYFNRYPGARCDIESIDYSYSFSPELDAEWDWPERYATQPDILRYLEHVAQRFDLLRDIQLNTRVKSAAFDETAAIWLIETDQGQSVRARFCVMATGCLSASRTPQIDGLETFTGATYHTAHWPHDGVDFSGQNVVVLGTGSSGIQSIPEIAKQAAQVTVLQRTPNFIMPAWNGPLSSEDLAELRRGLVKRRSRARAMMMGIPFPMRPINARAALEVSEAERLAEYELRWSYGGFGLMAAFNDLLADEEANQTSVEFMHGKIRGKVHDPEVAAKLMPTSFPLGAKRLCVDTGYYEAFNRDNVRLIDLSDQPLKRIEADGVRVGDELVECDAIVFATGFDAMTGALAAIDIRGRDGIELKTKWAAGPRTYLGLSIAGFPNLFLVTGPGSPSVLSNMVLSIEQHVDWIGEALKAIEEKGATTFEADEAAEGEWVEHVNEVAARTLYMKAASWYLGANVEGKPRVFMPYVGGVPNYRAKCSQVVREGYAGFSFG